VEADSGAIGGNESHEFVVLADTGESEIVYCENGDYAANVEKAACVYKDEGNDEAPLEMQKIHTPGMRTIKDLVEFTGQPEQRHVKTLTYYADGELVAAVLRGIGN